MEFAHLDSKKIYNDFWQPLSATANKYQVAAIKAQEIAFIDNFWPKNTIVHSDPKEELFWTKMLVNHLKERKSLPEYQTVTSFETGKKYLSSIHQNLIKIFEKQIAESKSKIQLENKLETQELLALKQLLNQSKQR